MQVLAVAQLPRYAFSTMRNQMRSALLLGIGLCAISGCTHDWSLHTRDAGADASAQREHDAEDPDDAEPDAGFSDNGKDAGRSIPGEPALDAAGSLNPLVPDSGRDGAASEFGDASTSSATVGDAGAMSGGPDAAAHPQATLPDAATPGCSSAPCMNGGTCADGVDGYTCSCPDKYMGQRCELWICADTFIRSRQDLEDNNLCGEIRGNLYLASAGLSEITASDLPYLTKVTGTITIDAANNNGVTAPALRVITLSGLKTIEGSLGVVNPGASSAQELYFPALTSIGVELSMLNANTRILELPALTTVGHNVSLLLLHKLCSVRMQNIAHVGNVVGITDVFNAPASAFAAAKSAASGTVVETNVGCCYARDQSQCDGFYSMANSASLCGCDS